MGKRELIALLNLSSWCLVMVEPLFLAVPRGCLQFVIVLFPDHTHSLFFKPSSKLFLLTSWRRYCFCGSLDCVIVMSCVCHASASAHCCLVVTCWERADLLVFVLWCLSWFCHFPMWYPESGVVLDCIDSWSLLSFLLCSYVNTNKCHSQCMKKICALSENKDRADNDVHEIYLAKSSHFDA